jgi:plastocyanin
VLRIGAEDSEGFSLDRLTMTAGEVVTVVFRNTDSGSGEPHNWHLVTPECVPIGGDVCFTNLEEGPDTQELTFTVNTPGEYQFVCDTHLPQMEGFLIVEP